MTPTSFNAFVKAASIGVANHLWQSTLVALLLGGVALAFRNNHARVRFAIWFAASIKFLIPFSLLIGLGGYLASPRPVSTNGTVVYSAIEMVGQPFTSSGGCDWQDSDFLAAGDCGRGLAMRCAYGALHLVPALDESLGHLAANRAVRCGARI